MRERANLSFSFFWAGTQPPAIVDSADVWLTVPAAWDARGCDMMREAAISAGLVRNVSARDRAWRDRLRIITYGSSYPCSVRLKSHQREVL